jgi:phosphatidylglycerophosphatase A
MGSFLATLSKLIASVFYVGYIPLAPGTFGTLAALGFVWLLRPEGATLLFLWPVVFLLGVWGSHRAEEAFQRKDCQHIVIDEFAGYLTAILFLPLTPGFMIAAFVLFRLLDITKPPPIRQMETLFRGGMGVMMDDVVAGLIANLMLQVWRVL